MWRYLEVARHWGARRWRIYARYFERFNIVSLKTSRLNSSKASNHTPFIFSQFAHQNTPPNHITQPPPFPSFTDPPLPTTNPPHPHPPPLPLPNTRNPPPPLKPGPSTPPPPKTLPNQRPGIEVGSHVSEPIAHARAENIALPHSTDA